MIVTLRFNYQGTGTAGLNAQEIKRKLHNYSLPSPFKIWLPGKPRSGEIDRLTDPFLITDMHAYLTASRPKTGTVKAWQGDNELTAKRSGGKSV